jgi:L-galactono-1,4-lactone dehydrogenase
MDFMTRLLEGIEQDNKNGIPAHSPIEQRWTASSSSLLSPASAHSAGSSQDGLHSWVGIISYLPAGDEDNDASIRQQRDEITNIFTGRYCDLMQKVGRDVQTTSHWAKLEQPLTTWQLVDLRLFLQERFPIQLLNQVRGILDPKNLLGNQLLNSVLGKPSTSATSVTGTMVNPKEQSNTNRD